MRVLDEFNGAYKDKLCFILGSGPSLAHQDLSPLADYVTFTVNSSILAYPKADFFVSDDIDVPNWSYYSENLVKAKNTTVLLYQDKLASTARMFGKRTVLFKHRQGYNITDNYDHDDYDNRICQARTSLGSAIHISHIMGCSPIVILGLDCCRSGNIRWFWQIEQFPNKTTRTDGRVIDKYRSTKRKGVSTDTDLTDILRYWQTHGSEINKSCSVYNASEKTAVDIFPKMSLNAVLEKFGDRL